MARFNPRDITSLETAEYAINANFDDVAEILEKVLIPDGSPTTVTDDVDFNHQRLKNVGYAEHESDAVPLGQLLEVAPQGPKGDKGDQGRPGAYDVYTLNTLPEPENGVSVMVSDLVSPAGVTGTPAYSNGIGWYSYFSGFEIGPVPYNELVTTAVTFTSVNGQSLAQSHSGGMNETLTSPYMSRAFPRDKTSTNYADIITNVVATDLTISAGTVARRDGESPVFGQLEYFYDITRTLTNVDAIPHFGVNRGYGSTPISVHVKGQANYNNTINALIAAKAYADDNDLPFFDLGYAWFQGEGNMTDSKATYQAALQGLARDYAADRANVSGQEDDAAMFTYVTDRQPIKTAQESSIPRAQFQAAVDYYRGTVPAGHTVPAPVILSSPTYFMPRLFDSTGVHVSSHFARVLGAYVALAQFHCYTKRSLAPLNERLPPMHPIDVEIVGGVATITYLMRLPDLELEWGITASANGMPNTDAIPEQPGRGFAVSRAGVLQTINTPEIINGNQVRITLASGSFQTGDRIGYALDNYPVHMMFFTETQGSCGNLRDNHGDSSYPMAVWKNTKLHNWMAPHYITLGSGLDWTLS